MKNLKINKSIVVLAALVVLSSCQDLFKDKDIKTNPNYPTDAPAEVIFNGALVELGELYEDTDARIAAMWSSQLTGLSRQHLTLAEYQVNTNTFGWFNYYYLAGHARLVQDKYTAFGNFKGAAAAAVVEVMAISKLTVLFGNIPYSEALQIEKFPHPKYDAQADVYTQMISRLNDAIANFDKAGSISSDFIYGNDDAAWKAAANTLVARLYLHLGQYANAISAANNGIPAGGDMLMPHGTSQGVDQNLHNVFFDINRPADTGCSYTDDTDNVFLVDLMKGRNNANTDETALINHFFQVGLYTPGYDPNTTASGMFSPDAPFPLLTFYENQLILAEAKARTNDLNGALAALNAVRAQLSTGDVFGKTISATGRQYDSYALSDFDAAGIANPKNLATQQEALIYEILAQKYILTFMQFEAYTDLRRSFKATPLVTLGIPAYPGIGQQIPNRYVIPQGEINTNPNTPNPVPDKSEKIPIFQ
ncbi:MAG: SusD/RagB family nutrient-binding outer membrane lipoprotein [Cyclobacteriaceae bacterium]|nr:SusD/RagB family nutrient-binding outer membrane lipoprotein [Cyclobacteriaceae bacterium]